MWPARRCRKDVSKVVRVNGNVLKNRELKTVEVGESGRFDGKIVVVAKEGSELQQLRRLCRHSTPSLLSKKESFTATVDYVDNVGTVGTVHSVDCAGKVATAATVDSVDTVATVDSLKACNTFNDCHGCNTFNG